MSRICIRPSRRNARLAVLFLGVLASTWACAAPANCDSEMTPDQSFLAKLCAAHPGCRFVLGISDSCVQAKSFVSKLSPGANSGGANGGGVTRVTDEQVTNALAESGVPPSGIAKCLFEFDAAECKEHLSGGRKGPSSKEQADEIVTRLSGKVYSTTAWDAGLGLARVGLHMCEDATSEASVRDAVRAKERCSLAEGNIRACLVTKAGHDDLRGQLQALILGGKLGADAASYQRLASTAYPVCPTTLPSSGKTPAVALANYLKFWDTKEEDTQKAEQEKANKIIARCDALRRDISDAMDLNELDGASALIGQFDSACSRENGTYAGLARLYRQKLDEARAAQPPTALIRRGDNSGSALFKSAIDQAAQDERDRPAREARERLAAARAAEAERQQKEQERLQEEQAAAAARAWSAEDRRGLSDALKGLATAVDAYSKSKGKAGVSAGGTSTGSIPVCTPGPTYDAKKCSCTLHPAEAGCPGAPQSGGINCWGQGPECRARYLQGK